MIELVIAHFKHVVFICVVWLILKARYAWFLNFTRKCMVFYILHLLKFLNNFVGNSQWSSNFPWEGGHYQRYWYQECERKETWTQRGDHYGKDGKQH